MDITFSLMRIHNTGMAQVHLDAPGYARNFWLRPGEVVTVIVPETEPLELEQAEGVYAIADELLARCAKPKLD